MALIDNFNQVVDKFETGIRTGASAGTRLVGAVSDVVTVFHDGPPTRPDSYPVIADPVYEVPPKIHDTYVTFDGVESRQSRDFMVIGMIVLGGFVLFKLVGD